MHHQHNHSLVFLSVIIAIFASYTALDLVNSLSMSKGRIKWVWLIGGSLAMGVGIWSMHFIGMLAFRIHGLDIYYDVPLLLLSIGVAIFASALALYTVASRQPSGITYLVGSVIMGAAIAGMHYIGIASMEMGATIVWDYKLVGVSILIALAASYAALFIAFKLRDDLTLKGFAYRGLGGVLMGFAISGMHYVGMAAMSFRIDQTLVTSEHQLLATDGLAAAIIIGTLIILGIALSGSNVDRALSRKNVVNDLLQEGIRIRDQFLSIASHELKTPLTSMKLQTELAIRQLNKNAMDKDYVISTLEKTNYNLNRITHLVDDMLDISRITSGKLEMEKTEADLGALVVEVIDRFKPQLEMAGIRPINFVPTKVVCQLDVFRIEQVINNLLSNAIKYGNKSDIEVTLREVDGKAILSIKDSGLGIPKDYQSKIFDRFERVGMERGISGLGLGLFIVKEIVVAHEGKIWVESDRNKGARFVVEFPIA